MPARFTILHIDDDTNDLTLFQHACRRAKVSFELQMMQEGNAAMDYLSGTGRYSDRSQHPVPSLVLLDMKMPGVSGADVLAWLRADQKLKSLPVIILSCSDHAEDINKAYELGANSYLVKPLDLDGLVEVARLIDSYWANVSRQPEL